MRQMKRTKHILALILLLYPIRHCMMGVDLGDAGYSLGNYRFFDCMNETWKLATYVSNLVGVALMHLPFGDTWIGMNVYTGLLIGITAAASYLYILDLIPQSRQKELLLFLAELVAVSFCWAPSVILYHYLGYIFMTVAVMLLYTAIIKDRMHYYIISGVILGLCVAVRMPNITYMAFILPFWYYCFIKRTDNPKWFAKCINKTCYCIAGYLAGMAVPIGFIEIRYGIDSYPNMVANLFGMTEDATDYKPTSMLSSMFGEYIIYGGWLLLFIAAIIAGVIVYNLLGKILDNKVNNIAICNKITYAFKIVFALGLFVLLRLCYGRGMFGIDYTDTFSMYKWMVIYLLGVILLCIWAIISKHAKDESKLWSVFLLVIIFVTPLGSNNGLYTLINNLFIVLPVSILLLEEFYVAVAERFGIDTSFFVKVTINFLAICIMVVGVLFGINYVFHEDGKNESKLEKVELKCANTANGLLTSPDKKQSLEELDNFLYENNLNDRSLITYGDIPALSYILNMRPAIYTTWPRLQSNPLSSLEADLQSLSVSARKDDMPIIIVGVEYVDKLLAWDTDIESSMYSKTAYVKYCAIEAFMDENGYEPVYENDTYRVYCIN